MHELEFTGTKDRAMVLLLSLVHDTGWGKTFVGYKSIKSIVSGDTGCDMALPMRG